MIKVAVVGCGYWGPNLVRNFQRLEGCELSMCCDLDPIQLAAIESQYPGTKTTTRLEQVLESDTDAVVLATPVRTHHRLGKQVLSAGKHLLVEKPLAYTAQECRELIGLAEQRGLVLMVGHLFLYNPAVEKLREIVASGDLGEMYYIYSQRLNLGRVQTDINALWSLAPHDISIAMYLLGEAPVEVSARGASYLTRGIEDVVFLSMTFPNGSIAHCHVSWLDPSRTRKVTLVGSKRMAVYDDTLEEGKITVFDKWVSREGPNGVTGATRFSLHSGDVFKPEIPKLEPLAQECAHFVKCIREGRRPLTDGVNGLEVVRVLEAAQASLGQHGAPVGLAHELVSL